MKLIFVERDTLSERLILWDIDGTLLKTSRQGTIPLHLEVVRNLGSNFSSIPFETAGMTDSDILHRLLSLSGLRRGARVITSALEELDRLSNLSDKETHFQILPGVVDTLEQLRLTSWKSGVLTGNTFMRANSKIGKSQLSRFFDEKYFFTCLSGESRQDIAYRVRKNLRALQVKMVVIIGDTPTDIEIARKVGFQVVAVATGKFNSEHLKRNKPDLLVDGLESSGFQVIEFMHSLSI